MAPQIYVELEAGKKASELAICRAIAAKHGLKVIP
jgi:DNA-binding XRE family transcriptional regulator